MFRKNGSAKERFQRNLEIERGLEKYAVTFSRWLWPWREAKLIIFISCLAALDYASTYAFLKLSVNTDVYESGPLASWALQNGGFGVLFLIDVLAVTVISAVAIGIRYFLERVGFEGYGRTAFVLMLIPYLIVTMAAIFNNIVITFI